MDNLNVVPHRGLVVLARLFPFLRPGANRQGCLGDTGDCLAEGTQVVKGPQSTDVEHRQWRWRGGRRGLVNVVAGGQGNLFHSITDVNPLPHTQ